MDGIIDVKILQDTATALREKLDLPETTLISPMEFPARIGEIANDNPLSTPAAVADIMMFNDMDITDVIAADDEVIHNNIVLYKGATSWEYDNGHRNTLYRDVKGYVETYDYPEDNSLCFFGATYDVVETVSATNVADLLLTTVKANITSTDFDTICYSVAKKLSDSDVNDAHSEFNINLDIHDVIYDNVEYLNTLERTTELYNTVVNAGIENDDKENIAYCVTGKDEDLDKAIVSQLDTNLVLGELDKDTVIDFVVFGGDPSAVIDKYVDSMGSDVVLNCFDDATIIEYLNNKGYVVNEEEADV